MNLFRRELRALALCVAFAMSAPAFAGGARHVFPTDLPNEVLEVSLAEALRADAVRVLGLSRLTLRTWVFSPLQAELYSARNSGLPVKKPYFFDLEFAVSKSGYDFVLKCTLRYDDGTFTGTPIGGYPSQRHLYIIRREDCESVRMAGAHGLLSSSFEDMDAVGLWTGARFKESELYVEDPLRLKSRALSPL